MGIIDRGIFDERGGAGDRHGNLRHVTGFHRNLYVEQLAHLGFGQ